MGKKKPRSEKKRWAAAQTCLRDFISQVSSFLYACFMRLFKKPE